MTLNQDTTNATWGGKIVRGSIPATSLFTSHDVFEDGDLAVNKVRDVARNMKEALHNLSASIDPRDVTSGPYNGMGQQVEKLQLEANEFTDSSQAVHKQLACDIFAFDEQGMDEQREKVRRGMQAFAKKKKPINGMLVLKEIQDQAKAAKESDEDLPSVKSVESASSMDEGVDVDVMSEPKSLPICENMAEVGTLTYGQIPHELRFDLQSAKMLDSMDQSYFHITVDSVYDEHKGTLELVQENMRFMWDQMAVTLQYGIGMPVMIRTRPSKKRKEVEYFRAIIEGQDCPVTLNVYLVDNGTRKTVSIDDCAALPPVFSDTPALSVACTLPDLEGKELNLYFKEKFAASFPRLPCEVLVLYNGQTVLRDNGTTVHVVELYHPVKKTRITAPFIPQ